MPSIGPPANRTSDQSGESEVPQRGRDDFRYFPPPGFDSSVKPAAYQSPQQQ
jgi:hypothetical protein